MKPWVPCTWRPRAQLRERLAVIAKLGKKLSDNPREWLRAGVFGGMDGMSSTAGLIAGMDVGGATPSTVLFTAVAAGVAGAGSMGGGEYVSVKTDNERLVQQVQEAEKLEKRFKSNPGKVIAETARLLIEKNSLTEEAAQAQAEALWKNPKFAAGSHVAWEHGEFAGNPVKPLNAAGSSFVAFGTGSLLPVLPYIAATNGVLPAAAALPLALAAGGAGLLGAGAFASLFSDRQWWKHGRRQLAVGGTSAGLSSAAMGLTTISGTTLADVAPAAAIASGIGAAVIAGYRRLKHRRQPSSRSSSGPGTNRDTGAPPR
ncbi:MAG: hypothetical protein DLM55_00880 [Acidimicrobiales bacterium]|nr:MAG: hypothetical protein DLM55_00880 [Acidimicrobiales bacterium]